MPRVVTKRRTQGKFIFSVRLSGASDILLLIPSPDRAVRTGRVGVLFDGGRRSRSIDPVDRLMAAKATAQWLGSGKTPVSRPERRRRLAAGARVTVLRVRTNGLTRAVRRYVSKSAR